MIHRTLTICGRELAGYFLSPLAYIFVVIFLLLTGFFTFAAPPFGDFLNTNSATLCNSFFIYQPWLYLILIPPIAMRLWSEELKGGTIELLFTMPISIMEAVIGKFIAAWIIIGLSLLLTFPYIITVNWLGPPDNGTILAGYLGCLLLAGSYLSVGCMTSSATENQIVSFIFTVIICLLLTLAGHPSITDFFASWAPTWITGILGELSIFPHFESIQKGVIRFGDILYFTSIIIFSLFATCTILKLRNRAGSNKVISFVGIVALLVVLLNINFLAGSIPLRYDITQDKLYTLSEGTVNVLGSLKEPITIRYYNTYNSETPIPLRLYAKRVEDLLAEYVRNSRGKIVLEHYNPLPDSDAEVSALMDGIVGHPLRSGTSIYLGLTVSTLHHNSTIKFLSPAKEQTLEYDITHSIYNVSYPDKPTVGLISSIPVMGSFQGYIPSANKEKVPWIFIQELQKNFNVKELNYETERIDENIDVLLIVHPKNLSSKTEFAVDQYLLNGGKVLAFVDPYCIAASVAAPKTYFSQEMPPPSASNLPNLFSAWGIEFFKPEEVVIAPDNAYHALNDPLEQEHPAILNITTDLMNTEDVVMSGLSKLNLVFAGAFSGMPPDSLTKTVLLRTAPASGSLNNFSYTVPTPDIYEKFQHKNGKLELMIRLSGTFPTGFPEGLPVQKNNKPEDEQQDKKILKQSSTPSSVILVGDVDMIFNSFCVNKQKVYDRTIVDVINNNLMFVENAVNQLSGDLDIINIRTRGTKERNFTKIEDFHNEARKKYQGKINLLEGQLKQTEEYLNNIQSTKVEGQQLVLSEKQLNAIREFRKHERKIKKELFEIRKRLRNEVSDLKFKIEIINIALIPLLLIVFGITLTVTKKKRRRKFQQYRQIHD